MSWECLIGCPPMYDSVDFGLCVCVGRAAPDTSPVRCVITHLTASVNIDVVSSPLATNV